MCHQSVGLIARAAEESGIPTISVTSAFDVTQAVKPPRSVFLNFPLGHQTGKPEQPELQRSIIMDAFRALETITEPGTIVPLPYVWDENDDSWEQDDYRPGLPTLLRSDRGVADPYSRSPGNGLVL